MTDDSIIYDEWLPLWEQHLNTGGTADLGTFIRDHCRDADPVHVAAFRRVAQALLSLAPALRRFGADPTPGPGDAGVGTEPAAPAAGWEPIPGYPLDRRLGRGGYGEVWRAVGPDARPVAIKFVPLTGTGSQSELRAADLMLGVSHPHLIALFAARLTDRHLVLVMELADGTLGERLAVARAAGQDGVPRDELLGYMAQAAAALDFLNAGGPGSPRAQHRDVKPQNLLLAGGVLKVADFGLVRCLEHTLTSHTGTHTKAYAAPEFFRNRLSSQSDQYSLAVTYCELRGGRRPFVGTEEAITRGHLTEEPDLSMLPPAERPVVRRALAKTPRHRWPSCTAFVTALRDGVDPAEVRREVVADPNNVTLRRLYLSVRTAAQLRADRKTRLPWSRRRIATATARVVVAAAGVSWSCYLAARDPEGGGRWFAVGMILFVVILAAVLLGESLQRRRGLRKLTSELGPVRDFPFPFVPLDEIRDHYSHDRDADDAKDPVNKNSAWFASR